MTFSPDGKLLATSGAEDGTVKLCDLSSRSVALRLEFRGFKRSKARWGWLVDA